MNLAKASALVVLQEHGPTLGDRHWGIEMHSPTWPETFLRIRAPLRYLSWGVVGAMVLGQAYPAAAASLAGASVDKINGVIESSDFTSVDEPGYSVEIATLFHGLASSGASTGPGAISSQSLVSIDLPPLVAAAGVGGAWRARSQANLVEKIHFGTDWCSPSVCLEALDIGIEYVEITFHVHASGGVTSFVSDTQFGVSDASVTLNYQLQSSRAVALMTQVKRSIRQAGQELDEGVINSASATLELRPGDQLELKMDATTFAGLHVPAQLVNDPKPSSGTAMADFAHTLRWEGVTDIRAFDINGDEVALAPGGRFTRARGMTIGSLLRGSIAGCQTPTARRRVKAAQAARMTEGPRGLAKAAQPVAPMTLAAPSAARRAGVKPGAVKPEAV
jgi:hypothetical protein